MDSVLTRAQITRWRNAVFAIFLASGLSIATWSARVPAIRDTLDISRTDVGLMLFIGGVASIIGLSISSVILARFGARRSMLALMTVFAAGIAVIGLGTDVFGSWPVVTLGLVLWGFGNGCLDVIMNVEAAAIEKTIKKTILPLFHAFFSFGTVIGAGLGTLAITVGLVPGIHLPIIAVLIVVIGAISVAFVPNRETAMDATPAEEREGWRERLHIALSAWREPRTYALGLIMLGMAFAEGGANDWLALGVVDGHAAPEAMGAAALATFSVCMTLARIFGGPLVDRFGRVVTLRVLSVLAGAGLLLFVLAPNLPLVFVGAALWGLGASLGFPLGMSAAADDPARAAARVSAASTIGYVAFLAGPPALGFISDHIGLLNTLYIILGLIVLSGFASGAARPIAGSTVGAGHPAPAGAERD
ncbi:MFS transporter [Microbacterium horticulturae]|uniref:MFS transporter n=1 Tax=Microbacterium horticulturae TaxID=3028316 RepID=A0ABY8C172_9MICO|nr:MFS transporter [Microbacterium sp. KACC 23027]WEG09000.1 MFS transporter [Microbacterium sp. KACC 23027]